MFVENVITQCDYHLVPYRCGLGYKELGSTLGFRIGGFLPEVATRNSWSGDDWMASGRSHSGLGLGG